MLTTYHYAKLRDSGEIYAVEFRGDQIIKVCGPVDESFFIGSFPAEGLSDCPVKSVGWLEEQTFDWVAPGGTNPSQDQQSPRDQPRGAPEQEPRKGPKA